MGNAVETKYQGQVVSISAPQEEGGGPSGGGGGGVSLVIFLLGDLCWLW